MPILYSFRRCPYAIRARLALRYSDTQVELREVVLKDKPSSMLIASPKATVPVLVLDDNNILDESIDIMLWALKRSDPDKWLPQHTETEQLNIIAKNDHEFKYWLDRYKYFERFPEQTQDYYFNKCLEFLHELESLIEKHGFLFQGQTTLADWAIFPFIRQFAFVDKATFDTLPIPRIQHWLNFFLENSLFEACMIKNAPWQEGNVGVTF